MKYKFLLKDIMKISISELYCYPCDYHEEEGE